MIFDWMWYAAKVTNKDRVFQWKWHSPFPNNSKLEITKRWSLRMLLWAYSLLCSFCNFKSFMVSCRIELGIRWHTTSAGRWHVVIVHSWSGDVIGVQRNRKFSLKLAKRCKQTHILCINMKGNIKQSFKTVSDFSLPARVYIEPQPAYPNPVWPCLILTLKVFQGDVHVLNLILAQIINHQLQRVSCRWEQFQSLNAHWARHPIHLYVFSVATYLVATWTSTVLLAIWHPWTSNERQLTEWKWLYLVGITSFICWTPPST